MLSGIGITRFGRPRARLFVVVALAALLVSLAFTAQAPHRARASLIVVSSSFASVCSGCGPVIYGMAVDGSGNLYVVEGGLGVSNVEKFDSTGHSLLHFAEVSGYARGIGVDSAGNNIYVSDTTCGCIYHYDGTGKQVGKWTGFDNPVGVTVDPFGNVWTVGWGNTEPIPVWWTVAC